MEPKYGEIEEITDELEERFEQLKNFETLSYDPPRDHQYYNEYKTSKRSQPNPLLVKRMDQERKLLEESLPKSIFVRAYSTQIDLLRAAIVSPNNTPYSHSLFFFDILIPKGYPSSPPKLHYLSYDVSLSPSFGKDGKVINLKAVELCGYCGILRRSNNKQEDEWNPKESCLLDVLLAVKKSIFDHGSGSGRPYKDDTLTERCESTDEGEYNKMVWLSSCRGMLRTLNRPPADFEVLVRGHFRKNAHYILLRFREFKDDDGEELLVSRVFNKLLNAFEANGTYCKHHIGQVGTRVKK